MTLKEIFQDLIHDLPDLLPAHYSDITTALERAFNAGQLSAIERSKEIIEETFTTFKKGV